MYEGFEWVTMNLEDEKEVSTSNIMPEPLLNRTQA